MQSSTPRTVTDRRIPGGWSERDVTFDSRRLRILLPARPDELLEQLDQTTNGTQESDPYWGELWPASLQMARRVCASSWPHRASALELGCGLGVVALAGLVAGLDVTVSDRVEIAVATAVENARRNGFHNARGLVFDWRHPPSQQFPIILASDVLYDRDLHAPLLRTITWLLAKGGECWIGDPGRSTIRTFLERVARTNFSTRILDEAGQQTKYLPLGEFRLIILRAE